MTSHSTHDGHLMDANRFSLHDSGKIYVFAAYRKNPDCFSPYHLLPPVMLLSTRGLAPYLDREEGKHLPPIACACMFAPFSAACDINRFPVFHSHIFFFSSSSASFSLLLFDTTREIKEKFETSAVLPIRHAVTVFVYSN